MIAWSYNGVYEADRRYPRSATKLEPKRRAAIYAKLDAYALGQQVDIKKMKGCSYFRIRVGQDRVVIDDLGRVVMVIGAGPRGSIYKE